MKKQLSTQNNQKHSLGQKNLFLILDLMQKRIFNTTCLILAKRRFQQKMVKDPVKLCFQHKMMKNTVLDKTLLSQPRLDAKRSFDKKWLILSKMQILTQNGVDPQKLCFQHKIMKNTVRDKKRLSHPRLHAKTYF